MTRREMKKVQEQERCRKLKLKKKKKAGGKQATRKPANWKIFWVCLRLYKSAIKLIVTIKVSKKERRWRTIETKRKVRKAETEREIERE